MLDNMGVRLYLEEAVQIVSRVLAEHRPAALPEKVRKKIRGIVDREERGRKR
jgi:trimethylamine:corrinoid methyltransferase-like protein